jgi:excisionase family DNA binding protein
MANPSYLFRVDRPLDEMPLHVRPWADDDGSPRLGHDVLARVLRKAGAVDQVSGELGRDVASPSGEVIEVFERPSCNPLAVTVQEAARLLGVGRPSMLALLGSGRVLSFRVGGRRTGGAR